MNKEIQAYVLKRLCYLFIYIFMFTFGFYLEGLEMELNWPEDLEAAFNLQIPAALPLPSSLLGMFQVMLRLLEAS